MKYLFCVLVIVISFSKNVFAQNNCSPQWKIACYGNGIDEYGKIPPPENFGRGSRGLTIDVNYQAFTTQAHDAYAYAMSIWESILNGTQHVKVNAIFIPMGNTGLLGITFPNGRKNFSGALVNDVWYPTSLANQLAGTELNPGEYDVDMYLNASANWYYGTDGNCPAGKYDFVSVALHELGHGLGFIGLSKVDTSNGLGSLGMLLASDFYPLTTSFAWPQLDTFPGVFDHYLINADTTLLTTFPNPSDTLASEFTSNGIYWSGTNGISFAGNQFPRIYAPATFALGSSMVHLNEASYPVGNPNELMTPFASSHSSNHNPGPITLAILKDIGWNIDPTYNSTDDNLNDENNFSVYPNPTSGWLVVSGSWLANTEISISDILGREMKLPTPNLQPLTTIDISYLSNGIYFLRIKYDNGNERVKKFVKQN